MNTSVVVGIGFGSVSSLGILTVMLYAVGVVVSSCLSCLDRCFD